MDESPPSPSSSLADDASPPSSPSPSEENLKPIKKRTKQAEKAAASKNKVKKPRKKDMTESKKPRTKRVSKDLTATQSAVNDQMRRVLDEDIYSAIGSIVDTDTDDDDFDFNVKGGGVVRLDRNAILAAMRKRIWVERNDSKKKRKKVVAVVAPTDVTTTITTNTTTLSSTPSFITASSTKPNVQVEEDVLERDEGSIFGQTTGATNATWVECDKCKKWRRLRGVVDEKKLPSKWYCSMNKNDPERARCSAPEEEYETPNTPESAADARTRKHLRVWVRRLESNENYEARQPTMTRGKKRSAAPSAKEPLEWIRCCNPSCGKWRALLRCMDSRGMDREWYCVMNTWDEKMASCAAPQENLPALGCPPWVAQDEKS